MQRKTNIIKNIAVLTAIILFAHVSSASANADVAISESSKDALRLIVTESELSDSQIAQLRAGGVEILDYNSDNSYIVIANDPAQLEGFSFVTSSSRTRASEKLSPALKAYTRTVSPPDSSRTISPAGTLEVTLSLYSKKSYRSVVRIVERFGGTVTSRKLMYGSRVVATVPLHALEQVARYDVIRSISFDPRTRITNNVKAAKSANISAARKVFGLTGAGVIGGIWDGGAVEEHPDLVGQFEFMEKGKVSDHATHVAGTIVGTGNNLAKARGMAPDAFLYSYNFAGKDIAGEMAQAAKDYGILFSNNSWSYSNGWSYHYVLNLWLWWGNEFFGHYSDESAAFDQLVEETDLIVLFAAGNDRADKGTDEPYLDMTIGRGNTAPHDQDGPYRTIDVTSTAKNVISVGAVTVNDKMTSFSSWGPTKDGRVKPEVVADGYQVTSTVCGAKYDTYSGTSMATPTVSGGVALIIEQFRNQLDRNPGAALIRALLAASAKDSGPKGPDYCYGFGLFDALRATQLVEESIASGLLVEDYVRKARTQRVRRYRVQIDGGTKAVKFALAWIDPAARPNAKKTLVNDLDIKVYAPGSDKAVLPWVLDGEHPELLATRGVNTVDNIEVIDITNPQAGEWIVEVNLSSMGKGSRQDFALVVNSSAPLAAAVATVK